MAGQFLASLGKFYLTLVSFSSLVASLSVRPKFTSLLADNTCLFERTATERYPQLHNITALVKIFTIPTHKMQLIRLLSIFLRFTRTCTVPSSPYTYLYCTFLSLHVLVLYLPLPTRTCTVPPSPFTYLYCTFLSLHVLVL